MEPIAGEDEQITEPDSGQAERRKTRAPRQTAAKKARTSARRTIEDTPEIAAPPEIQAPASNAEGTPAAPKKTARKAAPRSRRPRKTAATNDME